MFDIAETKGSVSCNQEFIEEVMRGTFFVTQDRFDFMMRQDVKLQLAIGNWQPTIGIHLSVEKLNQNKEDIYVPYRTVLYAHFFHP